MKGLHNSVNHSNITTLNTHTHTLCCCYSTSVCVCVCVCVCWLVCWYVWSFCSLMIHCCSFSDCTERRTHTHTHTRELGRSLKHLSQLKSSTAKTNATLTDNINSTHTHTHTHTFTLTTYCHLIGSSQY